MPRKAKKVHETALEPFPSILRKELEDRNMSQGDLANVLGVKKQTISLYCLGQSSPSFDKLCKIADVLEVSIDYLLGRTDIKTTNKDIQYVCEYTGLNDITAFSLRARIYERNVLFKRCVSNFIHNAQFTVMLENIVKLICFKIKFEYGGLELHKRFEKVRKIMPELVTSLEFPMIAECEVNKAFNNLLNIIVNDEMTTYHTAWNKALKDGTLDNIEPTLKSSHFSKNYIDSLNSLVDVNYISSEIKAYLKLDNNKEQSELHTPKESLSDESQAQCSGRITHRCTK